MSSSEKLQEAVEHALIFLDLAEWKGIGGKADRLSPAHFQRVEPFIQPELFGDEEFFKDASPADLSAPLDVAYLTPGAGNVVFAVNRMRAATAQQLRGKPVRNAGRGGFVLELAYVFADGKAESTRFYLGHEQGRVIARHHGGGKAEDVTQRVAIASGVQFNREYTWNVALGYGGGSIQIPTDPHGAREVFALRDVPAGKKRRAALRNWVAAHTRKKRNDPEALVEVVKHLRGAQPFSWNGLICTISPPAADVRELKR